MKQYDVPKPQYCIIYPLIIHYYTYSLIREHDTNLFSDFRLFTKLREVSIKHLQRMWHADGGG